MIDTSLLWSCSSEEYHASLSEDSHSSLQTFRQSVERYAAERVFRTMEREPPTPAMQLGSLVHFMVLEIEALESRYVVKPEGIDRRTKSGKEQWERFEATARGKTIISANDLNLASAMRDGISRNEYARAALEADGISEASLRWTCPETGCPLKCRLDRLCHSGLVIDVKSTDDFSPDAWARTVYKYKYHCQAALYTEGVRQVLGLEAPFLFIAVSKTAPHECAAFLLDDRALQLGRDENLCTLRELAQRRASGDWSGRWSEQIHTISLPNYAYTRAS